MFGFDGYQVPDHMEAFIRDYGLGNIILFRRNVDSNEQVKALTLSLQQLASQYHEFPLSIAIDQEGGMVARIDRHVTVMPGQMTLGATNEVTNAYEAGMISGMELAQLGITVNFAPVLDVNNNPLNPVIGIRSFGEEPDMVARFGSAMIRGYQEMGIAACAKHFPGHGDTTADSHEELPSVSHSIERIHQLELVPFKRAIKEKVEMIMTAHVQFPALEPSGMPATLSAKVLTGLLREELGYDGVIVTDCLEMNAIAQGVGVAKGAVEAFLAGADLILVSHQHERQLAAFHALEQAVLDGIISEERINQSVARIIAMKERQQMRVLAAKVKFHDISAEQSQLTCEQMMEQAVTLVQDERHLLPLSKDVSTLVIWTEVRRSTQVDEVIEQELTLGKQLQGLGIAVTEVTIGTEPTQDELQQLEVMLETEQFKQIIVCLYNAVQSTGQQAMLQLLKGQGHRADVIYVSLRNPYDYSLLSQDDTYICAYENRPAMLRAVGLALTGAIPFKGKLPVTLAN